MAEEILAVSDYISPKPNTTTSMILADNLEAIQDLDISPLNLNTLPNAKNEQLFSLSGSSYLNQSISGQIEEFGTYIFDSVLGGFSFSASNYGFNVGTGSTPYDITGSSNYFNTNQTISSNIIEGGSSNDVLFGNASDNIIRGNSLSASSPITQSFILDNPTLVGLDRFGVSIEQFDNLMIAGSYQEDTGALDTGSAYLYNVSTGILLATINNPTPEAGDFFGRIVGINENYIAIGAEADNTGAVNTGSVYIYDTVGNLLRTINNPTPDTGDSFGYSIAIDDNHTVVGAYTNDTGASNAGSAYIFDTSTGALLFTLDNPTPEVNDYFGLRVALEGNFVIVGARDDNTGATSAGSVYIYDVTTGGLLHTINNPTPEAGDLFGQRVAVDNGNIIIGARDANGNVGEVYIYDVVTGTLLVTLENPTPQDDDHFGESVAIDGNYAIVGATFEDTGALDTGSAYIFEVTTGRLLYTLNNPTPEAGDWFGNNVSISGNLVTVTSTYDDNGGLDAGAIYTYIINFDDADTLYGGAGNDTLYGLEGADELYGGAGADVLFGGGNSDRFVFESGTAFDGLDRIEDFSTLEQDVIDISDVLVGYNKGVDDIADFVRFVDDGGDTVMQIDADGLVGGVSFETVAEVVGGAGLNALTLEMSGNLDTLVQVC